MTGHRKLPKLPKLLSEDFNLKSKKKTLISKDLNLLNKYIRKNDNKDIIIPLSEIINHIHNKSLLDREHRIIYWISWLFECEKKFHNKHINVEYRDIVGLDNKYCNDFIWIIWEMLIDNIEIKFKNLIINLFNLFKSKYTKSTKKNKVYLLITAVLLLVNPTPKISEPIEINSEIVSRCNIESLQSNNYCMSILTNSKYKT